MLRWVEQTSMEQKIHRIKVCTTTSRDAPIPNAKYTPIYFPTWGFLPNSPLTSDHRFSQTLPPTMCQSQPLSLVLKKKKKKKISFPFHSSLATVLPYYS